MNPTREEALFAAALERSAEKRPDFLDGACLGDAALRERVEALLASHAATANPLHTVATMKLERSELPDEAVGQTLGRYKLLEKLGEGGCGVVYVAEQTEPVRRRVALKVIKLGMDTKQVVARFEAERQALAMMDHPNIAKVFDAGTTEQGRPYFVMELVRGIRITDYCDQASLETKDRLDLFIKVCQAIQHAHQKGIIHRDIKPSNILVTLHDGVPVPKVIDFGIAKATEGRLTDNTVYTQLHQFIGTPAYMSPEQAEMSGLDIDTRSDIYSLGVLLYELLAGSTPFDPKALMASGIEAMRKTIREKEPQRPSTRLATLGADQLTTTAKRRSADMAKLLHQLQGDLDWIVMKCLEKDRTRRYQTANGLAADLKRHLDNEPITARPPSTGYRLQKAFRRNKLAFAAVAGVVAALLLGVVASGWQAFRAMQASRAESHQRRLAEAAQTEAQLKQREAEAERNRAETQEKRADAQALKAIESQEQSRRLLYASDMNLVQQSIQQNNLGRAITLLDRHRPAPGQEDLRGWEWRYLWQQCRGDALVQLTQRPARCTAVSFSPDGALLAVGFFDGRIELWDPARRILLEELNSSGPQGRLAFSPRSNVLVATTGTPGMLRAHDFTTGQKSVVRQGEGFIRELSFTSDGSRVAAFTYGTSPPSAVVIDMAQGAAVSTNATVGSNMHTGIARHSSDHKRLYLSHLNPESELLTVRCLELGSSRELWRADVGTNYGVSAMALSPDEKVLVTGTAFVDAPIRVWDTETGKLLAQLDGHTGWVGDLTFSRDGRWLASAAADQTLRLWETRQWTEARVFRGHQDEVASVTFSPDGRMLVSGSKDGVVLLWDIAARPSNYGHRVLSREMIAVAEYAPGLAIALAVDQQGPRGTRLRLEDLSETALPVGTDLSRPLTYLPPNLFGYYEQTNVLRITEYRENGTELFREAVGAKLVTHPQVPAAALAHSREHGLIAWADKLGTVHIAGFGQPARRWRWPSDILRPCPRAFSPDGKLLVVAETAKGTGMELREVETGRLVLKSDFEINPSGNIPEHKPPVWFADAGRKLIAARQNGNDASQVALWDLAQPEQPPVRFDERGTMTDLSVSPDGRWAAVSTQAGIAVIYETSSMTRRHELPGSMQAVFSITFSPDSRCLATGAGGRDSIKLWQVETGQELLALPSRKGLLMDIAFAEGGNTLLLGRFERPGSWQMWRAPSWEVIAAAEVKGPASRISGGQRNPKGIRP